jgi:hypothetical protein
MGGADHPLRPWWDRRVDTEMPVHGQEANRLGDDISYKST